MPNFSPMSLILTIFQLEWSKQPLGAFYCEAKKRDLGVAK
jgi:hypothetical protein